MGKAKRPAKKDASKPARGGKKPAAKKPTRPKATRRAAARPVVVEPLAFVVRGRTAFPPARPVGPPAPPIPPSGVAPPPPAACGFESTVVGTDDRVRVVPIAYPYTCVCRLDILFGTVVGRGTGWLLTPTLVLTAGHNLYNRQPGLPFGWATAARVTFGFSTSAPPSAPPVDVPRERFLTAGSWLTHGAAEFDFGAIRLPAPTPAAVGTFGVSAAVSAGVGPGTAVEVPGYPDEVNGQPAQDLFTATAPVVDRNDFVLRYQVDTGSGQSGGPVVVRDPAGRPYVVGVHNYGDTGGFANQATWLVGDTYALIAGWAAGRFD